MNKKQIGKIKKVKVGMGGYQEACFGVSFTLGSDKDSWGTCDFWGTWADPPSEHAEWTKTDQAKTNNETFVRLKNLMQSAKVEDVQDLKGVPIEAEFESNKLISWRILEEAI